MEIPILLRRHLYIETAPRSLPEPILTQVLCCHMVSLSHNVFNMLILHFLIFEAFIACCFLAHGSKTYIYRERDYDFCQHFCALYFFATMLSQNGMQELYINDALCIRSKTINVSLTILALLLHHNNAYFFSILLDFDAIIKHLCCLPLSAVS